MHPESAEVVMFFRQGAWLGLAVTNLRGAIHGRPLSWTYNDCPRKEALSKGPHGQSVKAQGEPQDIEVVTSDAPPPDRFLVPGLGLLSLRRSYHEFYVLCSGSGTGEDCKPVAMKECIGVVVL